MSQLSGSCEELQVISVDEKTGMQALSRKESCSKGSRRLDFEYQRNGTSCLMAAVDVKDGAIAHYKLTKTRKEEDFLEFVKGTVQKYPQEQQVVFIADQLNTHLSESLVRWVAQQIDFQEDLGKKRYKGILKSKKTRQAFLENKAHRIRFVYTPKHCSWLNPIENWFARLQRQVIQYGNFASIAALNDKVEQYIEYYNESLKKPLNWKFKGFTKDYKFSWLE